MRRRALAGVWMLVLAGLAPVRAQEPAPGTALQGLQGNILELLQRQERLESELRQLRGEIETLDHELEGVKRRQRELYLDLDRRLEALEAGSGRAAPAAGAGPAAAGAAAAGTSAQAGQGAGPGAGGPGGGQRAATPAAAEQRSYQAAFELLKEGRYPEAIEAFRTFLQTWPDGALADNAQYWLGEANYVSRNYRQALVEFERVIKAFPDSPKVPDAMLKEGFTWYQLGEWQKARGVLEDLIARYPDTTAARLARTRLQRMKKEGH